MKETMSFAHTEKKRNTPVTTLIRNFTNRKSGKVAVSRDELQWRFDYLDWKDQKKIVMAFLESGKGDRQWAYTKALHYWDKSFEPKIKELWERLHEKRCSWPVIRYFPLDYLSQNIGSFTEDRDYYFLCHRLAADKSFVIDRNRLSKTDYLALLCHTGRQIEFGEAEQLVFDIVHDISIATTMPALDAYSYRGTSKGNIISPIDFQDVSLALYYTRKMGCNFITELFTAWNEKVKEAILNSPEFKAIPTSDISDYDYVLCIIDIARKYGYMLLDNKYKKPTDPDIDEMLKIKERYCLDNSIASERRKILRNTERKKHMPTEVGTDPTVLKEMIKKNPAIERLIDRFDLDANTDILIPF